MANTPGEIADILALRDLAYRYAQSVDRRDGEALAQLFTEDGVLDGSGYFTKGREGLALIPAMLDRRYQATFHAVQNHTIELAGDEATGEVYAISHHLRKAPDDSLSDYVMIMRYHDQYVRRDGVGLFAHRHILIDWTETRPAAHRPAPKPAA